MNRGKYKLVELTSFVFFFFSKDCKIILTSNSNTTTKLVIASKMNQI